MSTTLTAELAGARSTWGAVLSMARCVVVLTAAAFMPIGLCDLFARRHARGPR